MRRPTNKVASNRARIFGTPQYPSAAFKRPRLEKARSAIPAHPNPRAALASAYALKGDTQRAATELAEAQRLSGKGRWASLAGVRRGIEALGVPKIRALLEATYFAGLRKAGMPEE